MAEENPEEREERVVLDPRTLANLDPETLTRLRSEFGATVELRASKPGLAALLDSLRTGAVSPVRRVAEYDRGFDRTRPGYDKYYDRDRPSIVARAEQVTNPSIDVDALNRLFGR